MVGMKAGCSQNRGAGVAQACQKSLASPLPPLTPSNRPLTHPLLGTLSRESPGCGSAPDHTGNPETGTPSLLGTRSHVAEIPILKGLLKRELGGGSRGGAKGPRHQMSLTSPFPDKSSLISSLATIQWPHSHHDLLKNTPPHKKSCVE